jgi:arylsulfatase A-like enzyme
MASPTLRLLLVGLLASAPAARAAHDASPPASVSEGAAAVAPAEPSAPRRLNLLLITFDTLRRDHVSCYGSAKLTTPHVDQLASQGVLFTDVQGVVPITGPSHATIMTGLYPQAHGAFRNGVPMHQEPVTLAEMLKDSGYRTGAVVSGWTLRAQQCGLSQGFESYDDAMNQHYKMVNVMRRGDGVTDSAIRWLDAGASDSRPFFLFVHYFDAHEPYDLALDMGLKDNPAKKDLPSSVAYTENLPAYDNEIAYADSQLGRLLDHLRERSLLDRTLIVFTADHGQSFGDNGYGGPQGEHGRKVYQSQVAVPLVMRLPGLIPAGTRDDLPVSHIDIVPTIAGLLGIPQEKVPPALPGASLARVIEDPSAAPPWGRARRTRHGLAFGGAVGNKWNIFRWMQNHDVETAQPLCAYVLTDDGRKVIVDFTKKRRVEIYDLKSDPGEKVNLAGHDVTPDAAEKQGEDVFAWYDRTRSTDLTAPATSAEDLEKLRALGYVE